MVLRKRVPVLAALLAAGLLAVAAAPSPSRAEEATRQQQIAEIERQIQELQKKLEELRRAQAAAPAAEGTLPADWVKALTWRCIGPAAMGGRITDLAVFEADPTTYWVATASGGLLKTTNNGVTFEHQFDKEATVSIGAVAVAPSDKNIVWVGTGEANPRNSVSFGDGVYKSTDGGKKWTNMGLKKTFQTGRVVIHPKNPDVVYVGALGRLYGPNSERGLFKTTDGGKTWEKILYVDDKTGVMDVALNPKDPETLLVATWERMRDAFDSHPGNEMPPVEGYDRYDPIKKWGPGSGIHKSTDGGKTWRKLANGLPSSPMGRIDLDYYAKDPNVVFAVIDCQKIGMGTPPPPVQMGLTGQTADPGVKVTEVPDNGPAAKAGLKAGDVVTAFDKTDLKTYAQLIESLQGKKVGDKMALTVRRGGETKELTVTLEARRAGGQGGPGGGRFAGALVFGAFGEDNEAGVKITRLFAGASADKAGLQEGDVIKMIDKKPVAGFQQLAELFNEKKVGDKVLVQFARDNQTKDVEVTLVEAPQGFNLGPSRTRPWSFMYGGQQANMQDWQGPNGHEYGGVYKSTDGGETWARVNSLNERPMYFSVLRVDPGDDKKVYALGVNQYRSSDGGKTFQVAGGGAVHPDGHALWINPRDGRHLILGCDGGFYATYDRMDHWDHLNHLSIAQFYHVAVDSKRPYRVYGGLQDNGSWGGPSHGLSGGPINEDWFMVAGGDGFVCRVDPNDSDLVYYESQDGNIGRRNLRTGERASIRPRQPRGSQPYRFNWNTPFLLSAQNSRIFYCAGNYVFRSVNRGDELKPISPEITRTKRGSATALAESPRNPDVLWAGTDDGALWVTRDGGGKWDNVSDKVGLSGPRWVSTIEASRFADGRAYVVFDGHRSDDDEPHVYVTEDFGQTWKSLRANLPTGSTRVLREDVQNPDLLFLGTEFAAFASLNRGASWAKINNNLPTVAVHEFALHPTAGEMVAATHGRSLWVLDVKPLRQMTAKALAAKVHLYEPNPAVRWRREPDRVSMYGSGHRRFIGENPPPGAQVYYSLAKKADKISLKVVDFAGKTVRELQVKNEPGLHRVAWNLTRVPERGGGPGGPGGPGGGPGGRGAGGRGGFGEGGLPAPPGMYRVVLTVDGEELTQPVRVEADPTQSGAVITTDGEGDDR